MISNDIWSKPYISLSLHAIFRFCRYVDYIQSLTLINCKYIKVCPDAMLYVVLTSYVPTVYMSGQDIKAGQGGKNWDYSSYQHNVIIFFFVMIKMGG